MKKIMKNIAVVLTLALALTCVCLVASAEKAGDTVTYEFATSGGAINAVTGKVIFDENVFELADAKVAISPDGNDAESLSGSKTLTVKEGAPAGEYTLSVKVIEACNAAGDDVDVEFNTLTVVIEGAAVVETTTEAPTTEAPTTEAPTTEAPTTEAPATEEEDGTSSIVVAPTEDVKVEEGTAAKTEIVKTGADASMAIVAGLAVLAGAAYVASKKSK